MLIFNFSGTEPFESRTEYSSGVLILKIFTAAIIHIIDVIEPIIFGNSGPKNDAAKNHGTINDRDAITTM